MGSGRVEVEAGRMGGGLEEWSACRSRWDA